MKKGIIILILMLIIINLGIAKETYIIDFSKKSPTGNLVYELGKGTRLESEDGSYHLSLYRPESYIRVYTPVTKDELPFRVILKLYALSLQIPYLETWNPLEISVNDKLLIKGWDIGAGIYVSSSFDITSLWLKGETNKIEIRLGKDANGEVWIRAIELGIYNK